MALAKKWQTFIKSLIRRRSGRTMLELIIVLLICFIGYSVMKSGGTLAGGMAALTAPGGLMQMGMSFAQAGIGMGKQLVATGIGFSQQIALHGLSAIANPVQTLQNIGGSTIKIGGEVVGSTLNIGEKAGASAVNTITHTGSDVVGDITHPADTAKKIGGAISHPGSTLKNIGGGITHSLHL